MRIVRSAVTIGVCGAALVASPVYAQAVKAITLAPAAAKLDAEFIGMTSVRELLDGRAIVTDGADQKLYLSDFKANTSTLLGRSGKGPGEWAMVGFVYPFGRDSTVMSDMASRRWLIFDGARISSSIASDHPAVKEAGEVIYGADEHGHILLKKYAPPKGGDTEFTRKDSLIVALMNRTTGRSDTVTRLRVAPHIQSRTMDQDGRITSSASRQTEANAQEEAALLSPDGWLAVVRLEPLRVDWRSPSGQWTKGEALPLKPEPVDARDRKVFRERFEKNLAAAKERRMPLPTLRIPDSYNVMELNRGLFIASDGRLVIRRTSNSANPARRYLVISRRGKIDGQFTIGAKEDIIGFGAKYIYIGSKDNDDIQTLRRHAWP